MRRFHYLSDIALSQNDRLQVQDYQRLQDHKLKDYRSFGQKNILRPGKNLHER